MPKRQLHVEDEVWIGGVVSSRTPAAEPKGSKELPLLVEVVALVIVFLCAATATAMVPAAIMADGSSIILVGALLSTMATYALFAFSIWSFAGSVRH